MRTVIVKMASAVACLTIAAGAQTPAVWSFESIEAGDSLRGLYRYLPGVSGQALRFDGQTTHVVRAAASAPRLDGPFTIQATVAIQTYPWTWCALVNQEKDLKLGYFLGIDPNGHFGLHLAVGGKWHESRSDTPLPLYQWSQIAATYDPASGVKLYLNGTLAGTKLITGPLEQAGTQDLWIGRNLTDQNCMGCRLCQVACSQIKEQSIRPSIARVQIPQYYPGIEFPVLCYQCGDEAMCISACPVQALSLDSSKKLNTIKIDTTKCTRTTKNSDCTLCQDKCPGTAVTFHPTSRAPLICDLCGGDPECIKKCYSNTLTTKGVKMAAVLPADIAQALADQYKVPPLPKASLNGQVLAERDDDLSGDTV